MNALRELRQRVAVMAAMATAKLNFYLGHRTTGAGGISLDSDDVKDSWRFIHHRSQRQLRRDRRRHGH